MAKQATRFEQGMIDARKGMFAIVSYDDGTWEHQYMCPGGSYWIKEEICKSRQGRNFKSCHSCIVKCGGSADPRPALDKECDGDDYTYASK